VRSSRLASSGAGTLVCRSLFVFQKRGTRSRVSTLILRKSACSMRAVPISNTFRKQKIQQYVNPAIFPRPGFREVKEVDAVLICVPTPPTSAASLPFLRDADRGIHPAPPAKRANWSCLSLRRIPAPRRNWYCRFLKQTVCAVRLLLVQLARTFLAILSRLLSGTGRSRQQANSAWRKSESRRRLNPPSGSRGASALRASSIARGSRQLNPRRGNGQNCSKIFSAA